jgi:hypothetical protein
MATDQKETKQQSSNPFELYKSIIDWPSAVLAHPELNRVGESALASDGWICSCGHVNGYGWPDESGCTYCHSPPPRQDSKADERTCEQIITKLVEIATYQVSIGKRQRDENDRRFEDRPVAKRFKPDQPPIKPDEKYTPDTQDKVKIAKAVDELHPHTGFPRELSTLVAEYAVHVCDRDDSDDECSGMKCNECGGCDRVHCLCVLCKDCASVFSTDSFYCDADDECTPQQCDGFTARTFGVRQTGLCRGCCSHTCPVYMCWETEECECGYCLEHCTCEDCECGHCRICTREDD